MIFAFAFCSLLSCMILMSKGSQLILICASIIRYILLILKRIAMNIETHLLRVIVHVQKISLSVKFPCSVSIALKAQNQNVNGRGMHQLIGGETSPREIIKAEVEVQKFGENYQDKYINLVLSLISANGKISAGSVPIMITSSELGFTNQINQGVTKCPDKNAFVNYCLTTEFVKVVECEQNLNLQFEDFLRHQNDQETEKYSPITHNYVSNSRGKQYLKYSAVQDHQKRNFYQPLRYSGVRGRKNSPVTHRHNSNRKISRVRPQTERQRQKQRQQFNRLNCKLNDERERIWNLHKRQQQLLSQNNKLQEQLSQRSNRQDNYLQRSMLSEKQSRVISNLQTQVRGYEQKVLDLHTQLGVQRKKVQIKQANFQQQYALVLSKYKKAQEQKTNAMMNYNKKLQQVQGIQKKHRILLRQKQSTISQLKKQYQRKITQLQDKNKEHKEKCRQSQYQIKQLNKELEHVNKNANQLRQTNKELKYQQEFLNKELRKAINSKKQIPNNVHNPQPNNKIQHQNQIQQLQQVLSSKEKQHARQLQKMELTNMELNSKLIKVQQNLNSIKQMNKQYKSRQEQYHRERQQEGKDILRNNNQYQNKIMQLTNQIGKVQQICENNNIQSEQQAKYHMQSINNMQESVDRMRDKYNKLNYQYQQLHQELFNSNEQVVYMSRKLLEIEQVKIEMEERQRKHNIESSLHNNELQALQRKNKELMNTIEDRNNEIVRIKGNNSNNSNNDHTNNGNINTHHSMQLNVMILKEQNQKLCADKAILQRQLQNLTHCNDNLRTNNKTLQTFIQQLNQTILGLRHKVQLLASRRVHEIGQTIVQADTLLQQPRNSHSHSNKVDELMSIAQKQKQQQIIHLKVECEKYKQQIKKLKMKKAKLNSQRNLNISITSQKSNKSNINNNKTSQYRLLQNPQRQMRIRQLQIGLQERQYQVAKQKQKTKKVIRQMQVLMTENAKILSELEAIKDKDKNGENHHEQEQEHVNSEQVKEDLLKILKDISSTISKSKRIINQKIIQTL